MDAANLDTKYLILDTKRATGLSCAIAPVRNSYAISSRPRHACPLMIGACEMPIQKRLRVNTVMGSHDEAVAIRNTHYAIQECSIS